MRRKSGSRLLGTLAVLSLVVSGCTAPVRDGAPVRTIDPATVENAVPRAEPPSRQGNPQSYVVWGKRYHVLPSADGYVERGIASWYGTKFHGRRTSNGEVYDMYAMTAAHKSLPLPTYVEVSNLHNGRSVVVRVNDRGPFHEGRIIDLSYAAARKLGIDATGTAPVRVRALAGSAAQPAAAPAADSANAASEPPPAAPSPPLPEPPGRIFLQVGAFSSLTNAEELRARLSATDVTPVSVEPSTDAANPVYRVRVGPLASRAEADDLAIRLDIFGLDGSQLVYD